MAGSLSVAAGMDAHQRILIGLVVALLAGLIVRTHALWTVALAIYDAFALVVLGLICLTIALTPYERIRVVAQRQDVGRTVIFIFIVMGACAALFAVAFLIRHAKPEHHLTIHLLLALVTVVLSWLLMHAVFGLRYADNFYGDSDTDAKKHAGGLNFPRNPRPIIVISRTFLTLSE